VTDYIVRVEEYVQFFGSKLQQRAYPVHMPAHFRCSEESVKADKFVEALLTRTDFHALMPARAHIGCSSCPPPALLDAERALFPRLSEFVVVERLVRSVTQCGLGNPNKYFGK